MGKIHLALDIEEVLKIGPEQKLSKMALIIDKLNLQNVLKPQPIF